MKPMPRPKLFFTDQYVIPLPQGHRFPMAKYRMMRELLAQDDVFEFHPAPLAPLESILLAHDADYVHAFCQGSLSEAAVRRIGFPWSQALVQRSLASVGGTLAACGEALQRGWGGNLAGGTHHAFRAEGSGYCVFNDLAISAEWLRAERGLDRIAVLDLDVHQGDGTAEIFSARDDIFTASVHARSNFPFRKQQSTLDVELPDRTADSEYLHALDNVLAQLLAFEPQFILYQAGVDALSSDALGKLALTHNGLQERDLRVFSAAAAHHIPIAVTIGGGYSRPIELTVQAHATTYRTAHHVFSQIKRDGANAVSAQTAESRP